MSDLCTKGSATSSSRNTKDMAARDITSDLILDEHGEFLGTVHVEESQLKSSSPEPKPTLLTIPQEIRDLILEYTLRSKQPYSPKWWGFVQCLRSATLVCKQLRVESWPIFFKINRFEMSHSVFRETSKMIRSRDMKPLDFSNGIISTQLRIAISDTSCRLRPLANIHISSVRHLVVDFTDIDRDSTWLWKHDPLSHAPDMERSVKAVKEDVAILLGYCIVAELRDLRIITIKLSDRNPLWEEPFRLAKLLRPIKQCVRWIEISCRNEKDARTWSR